MHAILGWGSLIWDTGKCPIKHRDADAPWKPGGPILPLEFCRVSDTRAGALTLVVDPTTGAPCETCYTISDRTHLEDAICDLRCREGTVLKNISYVTTDSASNSWLNESLNKSVIDWARTNGISSVVWTGLKSNFATKVRKPFTPQNGLAYLTGLSRKAVLAAAEYIRNAPAVVDTPLRRLVVESDWWTASLGEKAQIATTIHGPSDLLNKLVRSQHRAWHAQHAAHVADHLYDFCVTALALRDHVFVFSKLTDPQIRQFHDVWTQDPAWAACRDIANAFKHLELRHGSGVGELKATTADAVDIYQSSEGTLRSRYVLKPDLEIVWPDEQRAMTVFDLTSTIIAKWMDYFKANNFPFVVQDDSELFGESSVEA